MWIVKNSYLDYENIQRSRGKHVKACLNFVQMFSISERSEIQRFQISQEQDKSDQMLSFIGFGRLLDLKQKEFS